MSVVCGAACGMHTLPVAGPQQLAVSLQELAPHGDRDHFVYVWQRTVNGKLVGDGIQVEHVTALDNGEFEVVLSENGIASGRAHIRADERALRLVSEDDMTRGVRFTYDPPLPYLEMPLTTAEQRASATATITSIADGQAAGSLQVTQVVQASAAPPFHSRLGTYAHPVLIRTVRTLQGSEGEFEMRTALLLAPGVGEIRSEGAATDTPVLYRELACATIAGHLVGDCHDLNARVEELKGAGSTHVQ